MASMAEVTEDGTYLEKLKTLAMTLAESIDAGGDGKSLAQITRQYRETIREIREIEGNGDDKDEIETILSDRKADGKSGAVRKSRTRL